MNTNELIVHTQDTAKSWQAILDEPKEYNPEVLRERAAFQVEYCQAVCEALQEKQKLDAALNTTMEALLQVCSDLAADDSCPRDMAGDFEDFPECATCPANIGPAEEHQQNDRDTDCWARYYLQRAEELRT